MKIAERSEDAGYRRIRQSLFRLESFFHRQLWPARVALVAAGLAIAIVLGALFFRYGLTLYEDWRQTRLLHEAASMSQQGRFSEAMQTARELLAQHPDSLPALHILAEAAEKQNLEEAISWREQIARLRPKDPDNQLNLVSAALRFGKLDLARKALDQIPASDRDRAAFHVVAGWLASAEGNFAARNPSDLASLMEWMNRSGLTGEVVKWIEKLPAEKLTSPLTAVAVANAYANAKNWMRLKRWTRKGKWGEYDYLRLAYQAIATRRSPQDSAKTEFQALWRAAEESSNDQPERELVLARLASKWNLEKESEQLWLRVAENPRLRREALDALRRHYRKDNDTGKLYDVLQRLHESSPNEAPITADLARLGLNLERNVERSHELAKEAHDRAPNEVNCAVTYAFSLYRLGRSAEALAIIQGLPADQLHDPHAAVYAALLLADASQIDAARDYVAAANDEIYPEEKALLNEARTKTARVSAAPPAAFSPSPTELTPTATPP